MILPALSPYRKRRGKPKAHAAPPALLTLIAASFTPEGENPATLTLTFSRAINPIAFIVEAFTVIAIGPDWGYYYYPDGTWSMPDSSTVVFVLAAGEQASGSGVHFGALPGNGIVAVDDGEAWAGVNDIELPYP